MVASRWERVARLIVSEQVADESPKYQIAGAVLAVLGGDPRAEKARWQLEVTERLKKDPWIAIVRTEKDVLMSESQLRDFWEEYRHDPGENAKQAFYFLVNDVLTGKKYVWFNNEKEPIPINTPEELEAAKQKGLQKGIKSKYVDYEKEEFAKVKT
jgi:hypothetical protein